MSEHLKKLQLTVRFVWRVAGQLCSDLRVYCASPYPFLLFLGALRRITRHVKTIWLPVGPGRPAVGQDLVDLILDMKRANWSWGPLRISQELLLLGFSLHKRTIERILKENGLVPPKTRITPPTWGAFLHAHKVAWALDFTCVLDFQGLQIFILVVVDLNTRQLVAINATLHPDRNWIVQQICNAEMAGLKLPTRLIADNDGLFGGWMKRDFKNFFNIEVHHTPPGQPWCNGICERFHRSLKREVLNRLGPLDVAAIQHISFVYRDYFNARRPHQGIRGRTPVSSAKTSQQSSNNGEIRYIKIPEVDGLITRFELAA